MTRKEAVANLNMISVAFVEPVTKEQRKLIDDTFDMAIEALEQLTSYEQTINKLTKAISEQEPFNIETYCKEHFMVMVDKDVWDKAEKALEQKPKTDIRECGSCKHSKDGHMAGTEECHECMWESKYKQETQTGHWIGIDEEPHEDYECDKCGYVVSTFTANIEPHTEYKYCPNCGAKMESEEKHDTDR